MAPNRTSTFAILVVAGLTLAAVGGSALAAPRAVARFERLKDVGTAGPVHLWEGEHYAVFVESHGGSFTASGLAQVAVVEDRTGKPVARAVVDLGGPSPFRIPPMGPALYEVLEFEAPATGNYSFEYRLVEPVSGREAALVVAKAFFGFGAARVLFFGGGFLAALGLAGAIYKQTPLPRRRKARRRSRARPAHR